MRGSRHSSGQAGASHSEFLPLFRPRYRPVREQQDALLCKGSGCRQLWTWNRIAAPPPPPGCLLQQARVTLSRSLSAAILVPRSPHSPSPGSVGVGGEVVRGSGREPGTEAALALRTRRARPCGQTGPWARGGRSAEGRGEMPGEATETVPATEQELPQPQAETAVHSLSSALSVTAALGQPDPALPPPSSLAPQHCPLATPNQPPPFLSPSAVASTPFEAPFPQSSSGIALPLGSAPSLPDTPAFLPNLMGPPISPAALALASPMITPTLKGARSSSAPLALVALAPHSVQKSYPPNPLSAPPSVAEAQSGSVRSLPAPIASPEPQTSPIQAPSEVVPGPKGTPIPPGVVGAVPSHFITPLASVQSGVASRPQTPPPTPLTITSSQVKAIPCLGTIYVNRKAKLVPVLVTHRLQIGGSSDPLQLRMLIASPGYYLYF
ncbi:nascent polypeptide-associated complex subunit alpha, muscle-specific form-like [Equus quagga]|uniref:nascent polypeptide-associated complex subunit alpha, muscle-specific form-like n=1 Tax=Equus quagga TaxID=89248 RepID=UPI001EE37954|nr:nascent polypeptide-associated complex subunit alpha, muscle-specific form-like [Equus quagga]